MTETKELKEGTMDKEREKDNVTQRDKESINVMTYAKKKLHRIRSLVFCLPVVTPKLSLTHHMHGSVQCQAECRVPGASMLKVVQGTPQQCQRVPKDAWKVPGREVRCWIMRCWCCKVLSGYCGVLAMVCGAGDGVRC